VLEEIEPDHSLAINPTSSQENPEVSENLSPEAAEEIRNLSIGLQQSHLQRRMTNFASFEPVSLPVSRVSRVAGLLDRSLPFVRKLMHP
jgi:hypothetical protein